MKYSLKIKPEILNKYGRVQIIFSLKIQIWVNDVIKDISGLFPYKIFYYEFKLNLI